MEHALTEIAEYLLHQSWQIAAIFVLAAVSCWALRKASAHWRYLLWLVVLAKCLTPPLVTLPVPVLPPDQPQNIELAQAPPADPVLPAVDTLPLPDELSEAPVSETLDVPSYAILEPVVADPPPAAVEPVVAVEPAAPVEAQPRLTATQWGTFGWIAAAGVFGFFALFKAYWIQRRLKRTRRAITGELRDEVAELARRLGLRGEPKVWLIDGIGQPFVWGLLRGSIYLPGDFAETASTEHRRGILMHELAHISRYDAAVNAIQILAQGVFFFHPLVWWANRRIRAEREKCCDEMAIAALAARPRQYSAAIVEVLVNEYESARPISSLAVAGPTKNIEERIKTIMKPDKRFYKRPTWLAIITVLLLAALAVPTALTLTARAEKTATRAGEFADATVNLRMNLESGKYPKPQAVLKVSDREQLQKLLAFFPQLEKKSNTAAGWKSGAVVELRKHDGSKVTVQVAVNDSLQTWNAGKGDWPVKGNLKAFLLKLQKEQTSTQPATQPAGPARVNIRGRVLEKPGGRGVGGIHVMLQTGLGFGMKDVTGPDGSYQFAPPASEKQRPMQLWVSDGSRPHGTWAPDMRVDVADKDVRAPDLHLRLPQSISGVVRDAKSNAPVAGQGVEFGVNKRIRTDEQGRYRLYLPPGIVKLRCRGRGGGYLPSKQEKEVTLPAGSHLKDVDLLVTSKPKITGVVVFPDGKPAPHVDVWLSHDRLSQAFRNSGSTIRALSGQRLKTSAAGEFTGHLHGLSGGSEERTVKVRAIAWSADRTLNGLAEATIGSRRPGSVKIVLVLGKTARVVIRILSDDGKPVQDAKLQVNSPFRGAYEQPPTFPAKHLGEGRYEVLLVGGLDYLISASDRGFGAARPKVPKRVSPKAGERLDAGTLTLVRLTRRDVPDLIKQLASPNQRTRERAAGLLGRIGPEAASALPALIDRLKDPWSPVRYGAVYALGRIGPAAREAVPELIRILREDFAGPRSGAAKALGLIGDPRALPALRAALTDKTIGLGEKAAEAIRRIEQPKSRLPATQPVEKVKTATPEEQKKIDSLLQAIWKAQKPVQNMKIRWVEERIARGSKPPGPKVLKGYPLVRTEWTAYVRANKSWIESQSNWFHPPDSKEPYMVQKAVYVFDGKQQTRTYSRQVDGRFVISTGARFSRDLNSGILLLRLFDIGLPANPKQCDMYKMTLREGDKPKTYILESVFKGDSRRRRFTIDGKQGFHIIKSEGFRRNGSKVYERDFKLKQYKAKMWYPTGWIRTDYPKKGKKHTNNNVKILEVKFDVDIPDELFRQEFPPGTRVWDNELRKWVIEGGKPTTQPVAAAKTDRVVRKRLWLKIPTLKFPNLGLNNVLNFFRNFSNCTIHVKWAELEKAGITRRSKVDIRLVNVTLDEAIRAVLDDVAGPGKLGFVVSDGVITISTQADLDRATRSATPKTASDVLAKMAEARRHLRSATYKIERQVHFVNDMRTEVRPPEKGALVVAAGTRTLHKERFVVSGAKYRHDENGVLPCVSGRGGLVPFRRFVAYDGKMKRTHNPIDGYGSLQRKPSGYHVSLMPLIHFHRGLYTMSKSFRVDALKLVGKKSWKGKPCYVLVEEVGAMRNEYYVDPHYDWALVSLSMKVVAPDKETFWNDTTMKWVGTGLRDLELEIAYKKDIRGLWLPAGWVVKTYGGWGKNRKPRRFHTVRVKEAKGNVNVPDSTFAIRFPDGTRVSDRDRGVSIKWDNSLSWKELDARFQRKFQHKADKIEQRKLERRLRSESKLKVGDVAPLFESRTIDGKRVRLADLRGKYVLMAFWGGGGNTSRRETPFLKAAYERGCKDPRFAMVSVTNNHERFVKRTTEWVTRNKVKWTVTLMENRLRVALWTKYGCSDRGWTFLIGPDGKVIARNLRGPAIKAAVEKVLRATPPATQPAKADKAAEANRAIHKRLRLKIPKLQFPRTRLKDVLDFFRNFSNCPIHVKWLALEKVGITKDSKVDVHMTNVTLDKAIRTVLDDVAGPGKLGFDVSDGVITISTQADLDRATITRVYDIRDLIRPIPDAEPVSLGWPKRKPKVKDKEPAPTEADLVKQVINLIKKTVAPNSWRPKGKIGGMRLLNGQLIITQAPRHHKSIQYLLKQLREARLQIVVEARFIQVSGDTDEQLAKWLKKQHPKATYKRGQWDIYLSEEQANALIKEAKRSRDTTVLMAKRVTLYNNGQRGYIRTGSQKKVRLPLLDTPNKWFEIPYKTGALLMAEATASLDRRCITMAYHVETTEIAQQAEKYEISQARQTTVVRIADGKTIARQAAVVRIPDGKTIVRRMYVHKYQPTGVRQVRDPDTGKTFPKVVEKVLPWQGQRYVYVLIKPRIIIQRKYEKTGPGRPATKLAEGEAMPKTKRGRALYQKVLKDIGETDILLEYFNKQGTNVGGPCYSLMLRRTKRASPKGWLSVAIVGEQAKQVVAKLAELGVFDRLTDHTYDAGSPTPEWGPPQPLRKPGYLLHILLAGKETHGDMFVDLSPGGDKEAAKILTQLRGVLNGNAARFADVVLKELHAGKSTTQPATQPAVDTITLVYDIRGLIFPIRNFEPVSLGWPKRKPKPKGKDKEPNPTKAELAEQVINLIKKTIAPDSWMPKGKIGSIRFLGGQLIVTQTPQNHQSIMDILEQSREGRSLQILVEAKFIKVSPGTDKKLTKWLTKQTKATFKKGKWDSFLSEENVKAFIKKTQEFKDARALTTPRLTLYNGQRAYTVQGTSMEVVMPLLNNKGKWGWDTESYQSGVLLGAEATVSANRSRVTLSVFAEHSECTNQHKQLPIETRRAKATATTSVPNEKTLLLKMPVIKYWPKGIRQVRDPASGKTFSEVVEEPFPGPTRYVYVLIKPRIIIQREYYEEIKPPTLKRDLRPEVKRENPPAATRPSS